MSQEFAKAYTQLNDAEKAASGIEKLLDHLDDKIEQLLQEVETLSSNNTDTKSLDSLKNREEEINSLIKLTEEVRDKAFLEEDKLEEIKKKIDN